MDYDGDANGAIFTPSRRWPASMVDSVVVQGFSVDGNKAANQAINGCIVTIDAMGCQTEIAAQIVEQGVDLFLLVLVRGRGLGLGILLGGRLGLAESERSRSNRGLHRSTSGPVWGSGFQRQRLWHKC
jgi:hypothetical protein